MLDWAVRYWERARKRRPAGARRLRRVLARLRMDGRAAPAEGARHLRAPLPSRRQGRLPRRHAARDGYLRGACARYRELAPLARAARRARGPSPGSRYDVVPYGAMILAAGRGERMRPADRRDAQAAARGRRQAADRLADRGARARRLRDIVINVSHLADADRRAPRRRRARSACASLVARAGAAGDRRRHRDRAAAAAARARRSSCSGDIWTRFDYATLLPRADAMARDAARRACIS